MSAEKEKKWLYSTEAIISAAAESYEKSELHELISIYRDDWLVTIRRALAELFTAETFKDLHYLVTRENNIVKRVVNDLSVIYNKPPTRRAIVSRDAEGNGVEDETYGEVTASDEKNLALKAINRYTNLINHSLLMVTFRKGKLDYDVINLDNACVFFDSGDWKEMVAVKYYIGLNYDTLDSSIMAYSKAYIWTKKAIENSNCNLVHNDKIGSLEAGKIYEIVCSGGGNENIISEEDNPYILDGEPVLPFVLFDREYPVDKRLDFTTGNDLRDLGINVAVILTMINQLYLHQTFKQTVISVPDISRLPNPLKFGPGNVLAIETGRDGQTASASVLDLQSNIEALQKTLEARVMSVLSGYGVSPQNFSMSATPQSGYALTISNMGKMETREAQLPLYRAREKELFEIERVIYNYHAAQERKPLIDVKATFEIDFAEITFPQSPTEQAQRYKMLKDYNVMSDIDIIMEQNPDIDRERAEQMYRENKALNTANTAMILPPMQLPGAPGGN